MNCKLTLLILPLLIALTTGNTQSYHFDFSIDNQQFTGGISDFAEIQQEQIEFAFENKNLELPLDTSRRAQYISGINSSDDLFMFMKRQITGLLPNTMYQVTFIVDFASHYPTNAIGVGGPPGEGVTMKAGMTLIEPDTVIVNKGGRFVMMNIDKGNQANPGPDMDTIGHVGVNDTTTVWAMKTNDNLDHPFQFTTDNTGSGWVIIGTDSGFESRTELFYTGVTVEFSRISSAQDNIKLYPISVYPNPANGSIHITSDSEEIDLVRVYDMSGRLYGTYTVNSNGINLNLPTNEYCINIYLGRSMIVKRVVVK